jgi:threonylcarbamoyladenosine tRNA methylthiotransferase MtaB
VKVYLDFLGCRLNEAELQSWARDLVAQGYTIAGSAEEADICVLNTCAVTAQASRKSRQRVRHLHKVSPRCSIIVAGCDATFEKDRFRELPGVSMVLDNFEKEGLVARVVERWGGLPAPDKLDRIQHPFELGRTRAFLKVQDGCNNKCTYCLVRILRGHERSMPPRQVIKEVNRLLSLGYQEIVLTGVHLASYGRDLGTSLKILISEILAETDVPRLRVSSLEPWDIAPDFFKLWSDRRLGQHLHLPLQSGSDSVLKRMGRKITSEQYARLVNTARQAIPDLTLTTDIMVGFPGETEEEFEESLEFIERMQFAHIHLFPFSPRPGTPAARMGGRVDGRTMERRLEAVRKVAKESKRVHLSKFIGQIRPVLWESWKPHNGKRLWSGFTDNYLRVTCLTDSDVDLKNKILSVRLTSISDDHIEGEL